MFKNILATSLRSFMREQRYTTINIAGLVVGLTTSIFIFLWVVDELSWDRFHADHGRIYQVLENQTYPDGTIETYDQTPSPLAEKLKTGFPEVEDVCRTTWNEDMTVSVDKQSISQSGMFADPALFTMFTFPLVEGNPQKLLTNSNSVVITQRMALSLFGRKSALGKTILLDGKREVTVTGVMKDIPRRSTFGFDFVLPLDVYLAENADRMGWTHHNLSTYVKLSETDLVEFNGRIRSMLAETNAPGDKIEMFLFRFADTHLFYSFEQGIQSGGRISYVRAFSVVAVFILLTACINFMNLATARAARRAREVGVRKVAGASRRNLVTQFIGESILLSLISLVIALLLVHTLTPLFNYVTNKTMVLDYANPVVIPGLLGITLITGLVAGSYPAIFLSSFRPAVVLSGTFDRSASGSSFRNGLVVIQFTLAVVMIVLAIVVNQQVQFIQSKELGYDREHVIVVPTYSISDINGFRYELLHFPFIRHVGQGFDIPPNLYNNDEARWSALPEGEMVTVQSTECDEDYIPAMGFQLVDGRIFSRDMIADSNAFVINEAAARALGMYNAVGSDLTLYKTKGKVIGVVADFHNRNLYSPIDPVVFVLRRPGDSPSFVFVRFEPGRSDESHQAILDVAKKLQPFLPLEMHDLDEYNAWMYQSERLTGRLSVCFTAVMLFIAMLGLFGLTSYTTERRRKEIGVRKVLGASVEKLVAMFCREFLRPLFISFFLGFPVAFYLMRLFLDRFEYRIDPGVMIFLVTGAGLTTIAVMTVGYQSASAANANPAETLRAE